ncbi:hypothetical protein ABZY19_29230 [Streptomyces sp. NPDC006475]
MRRAGAGAVQGRHRPTGHIEQLDDGTEVKLGAFLSNIKTRRSKLTTD